MAIEYPTTPQYGTSVPNYAEAIKSGLNNYILENRARYEPQRIRNEQTIEAARAKYAEPREQANVEATKAGTYGTNINNQELAQRLHEDLVRKQIENQYLPEHQKSQLAREAAQASYYKMGGGRGGVGSKDQALYQQSVAELNPDLTPEQQTEAANAYLNGDETLIDGTPLRPMTPLVRMNADRAVRSTTTAGLITQQGRANQAEAEIQVLGKYAAEPMKKYGQTYGKYSPEQIFDTLKNDAKSQRDLGRLVAAQALQYEIAQNRIKLAGGQPGVTSTQELMELSGQKLNTVWPKMSPEARIEAGRYLDEALKKGNEARKKVGFSPSTMLNSMTETDEIKMPEGAKIGVTLDNGKFAFVNPGDMRTIGNQTYYKVDGEWHAKQK